VALRANDSENRFHILDGPGVFERFDRLYAMFELDLSKGYETRVIGYQTIEQHMKDHAPHNTHEEQE
jgi:hypothetical protein